MATNFPAIADSNELFDLLESSKPSVVSELRSCINDTFNSTKETWLVSGLFDFYLQTKSPRCIEILSSIHKEPHDKYLIEKMVEGLKNQSNRKLTLNLLGHVVRKQPAWLYKIAPQGLVKELIRILRTDTDIVTLVSGLLVLVTALPIIPGYMSPQINDIFEVFSRLATWSQTNHGSSEEEVLHLQVTLYAMFHRLYGMYPCGFLSFLRRTFSSQDKALVFHHTIKPMLETVRMHHLLVTGTRDYELQPQRWKSKEYHDIMAECSKVSLNYADPGESDEEGFRPRLSSVLGSTSDQAILPPVTPLPLDESELQNLNAFMDDNAAGLTTPLTNTSQAPPVLTPLVHTHTADETAMEATPENTPLQTPVKDREPLHFKLPNRASPAAGQLVFDAPPPGKRPSVSGTSSNFPAAPSSTPNNSVPSSPLPQVESLSRRDSLFSEPSSLLARRDSLFNQRFQKDLLQVMADRQMSQSQDHSEPSRLQINIPSNTESETGHDPPGGPLTPLPLQQPPAEVMEDMLPSCHHEGSNCRGGLHMPDAQSLQAFASRVKRMRFYSQCENKSGESTLKRSLSCPEITEEPEDASKPSEESVTTNAARPFYEHLFVTLTDVWGSEESHKSPQLLLDDCIKKAASAHGNPRVSEQKLRAQIDLLHGQLLFERHRREAHTMRNRRLANKVRKAQNCEEQNSSFKLQIHQLEKEIANLKKDISTQRMTMNTKEGELCANIEELRGKLKESKSKIETLESEKLGMSLKMEQLALEQSSVHKELDGKLAEIFTLESNKSHWQRYSKENEELRRECEIAQKNILILGELCRRQDEVLKSMNHIQQHEDIDIMKFGYEEEIKGLRHTLETMTSQYEASLNFIHDLEESIAKKDKIIDELKKLSNDIAAEYQIQLRAMEEKYESAKSINHRLELEILSLNSMVAMRKIAGPTSPKAAGSSGMDAYSRKGTSPTDSDVDSATSAGGFTGLSSPDRNQFIFGSPQFDNPPPGGDR